MERGVSLAKTTRPSAYSVLPRERLFSALDAMRRAQVLWVHGPPGCGKTSLVSSYLDMRASNGIWYQIDAGDVDPASLCLYLAEAVKEFGPRLPMFTADYRSAPQAFARHYFRRLFEALEPPFLLVFDNYHEIGVDGAVHEMLREAVAELPADGCVLVISRTPPPAAFIRMRANRQLEVLDWDALRLQRDESDDIVRAHFGQASEATLSSLYQRTDGWAAALILALEQGGGTSLPPGETRAPLLLFEYLAGEVFSAFDSAVREMLVRTAFVEEMSVDLAIAMSGDPNIGERLDTLHRRHQLLTLKSGPRGPVYAWHPLLREYLLAQAQSVLSAQQRSDIVYEAASILEREGVADAALRLLAEYGDGEAVAGALLRNAAKMLAEGRAQTLERWLQRVPATLREEDPWLCYWHGACRFQQAPAEAQLIFAKAYRLFEEQRGDDPDGLALTAAYAMHAAIYALDDFSVLDEWIERAEPLALNGQLDQQAHARLAVSLFMAAVFRQPYHPRIGEWAERALDASRSLSDAQLRLSTQILLAVNLNYTGQFSRTLEFLSGMRRHGEAPGAQPLERTALKTVESMYHMLNADAGPCVKAVFDGLEIGEETGVQLWSYHLLSNGVAGTLGVGDLDTASELLEQMKDYEHGARTLDRSLYHYHCAWLAMLRGDADTARREQREALFQAEAAGCPFNVVLCRLALAQVLVEQGEMDRAAIELRKIHPVTRSINNRLLEYTSLLCFTDMALASGRRRVALAALRRGLQVGREHGFKHFLGWLPVVMSRICALALDEGIEVDYVQFLIRERGLTPPADGRGRSRWPWPMAIRTFGGFRVEQRSAGGAPLSGKPLGLLKAMVGCNGGNRIDEGELAALLWPRKDVEYARRSLTTTLHRLRKVIGDDRAVVLRHGRLSIARDLCRVDLDALDEVFIDIEALYGPHTSADTAVALAAKVLDVYQGPFMDGEAQAEFVTVRERVRNRVLGALDQLARVCESAGAPQRALALFRRAIEQDPLAEAFHRRLMMMLRELGRTAEAVEAYARCKSLLETAHAGAPSPETQAIYEAVKRDL